MTSLVLYGSNIASATLSTAGKLSSTTGGAETSSNTSGDNTTAQNFLEIYPLGGSSEVAVNAIPATPTGKGSLWDVTTLEGQTIAAGVWTAVITIQANEVISSSNHVNFHVDFYKRSSGGGYTSIGEATLNSQNVNTTKTTYTATSGSLSALSFVTGDKLYIAFYMEETGNWSGYASAPTITCFLSNSGTAGVANDFQVTTPGYSPTGAGTKPSSTLALMGVG